MYMLIIPLVTELRIAGPKAICLYGLPKPYLMLMQISSSDHKALIVLIGHGHGLGEEVLQAPQWGHSLPRKVHMYSLVPKK